MAGTIKRLFGPLALTNVLGTNVYQGGGGSALLYDVVRHIQIVNKTAVPVTFSLWLGATGANTAGTEVIGQGRAVPANGVVDWYGQLRMGSTDFLVGGASAATSLSIVGEGDQNVV